MGCRSGWMFIALVACGPEVATDGTDESTTGTRTTDESGSDPTTITTSAEGPDPTGMMPNPTSATTSVDTTSTEEGSSSDEDSSTTEPGCGCPPDMPIDFTDALERGFTPADALAEFDDLALDFQWIAYDGQPVTLLHVDVAHRGGAIAQGPGGTSGCGFLEAPCNDGIVMQVEVTLTTDDGWIAWTGPAQLTGVLGESLVLYADERPIAENAGALSMQPLESDGEPVILNTFLCQGSKSSVLDYFGIAGFTDDGGVTLGEML